MDSVTCPMGGHLVRKRTRSYGGITNRVGSARKIALALFGGTKRMETPEQRVWVGSILALSELPEMRALALRINHPMGSEDTQCSVAKLAENLGLTAKQLVDEFTVLMKQDGFLRMIQKLPDVMEQIADDAQSRDVGCGTCAGSGRIVKDEVETECGKCHGSGTLRILGDTDRLRLMFETLELVGKRGPGVNIDLRKIVTSESLSDLSQSIAPLLEGEVK